MLSWLRLPLVDPTPPATGLLARPGSISHVGGELPFGFVIVHN
jgi:hypothetical protein